VNGVRHLAFSSILFGVVWSIPALLTHKDDRGSARVMTLKMNSFSPAYSALEDTRQLNWENVPTASAPNQPAETLTTGTSAYSLLLNLQAVRSRELKKSEWLASVPMGGRIQESPLVSLKGLTIRQPKADVLLPEQVVGVSTEIQKVAMEEVKTWDLSRLSLAYKARQLVTQELERRAKEPADGKRLLAGENGSPILVAANQPPMPRDVPRSMQSEAQNKAIRWEQSAEAERSEATLSGFVRLKGGLALTGESERLTIYHEAPGLPRRWARVWLSEGRFEIPVTSSNGYVVGELRDASTNGLIGKGAAAINGNARVTLELSPVASGARAHVVSAYSYGREELKVEGVRVSIPSERAHLKADGDGVSFYDDSFESGSTYVMSAAAENHWGTLAVGVAAEETRMRLFPDRMMDALLNLTVGENRDLASRSGVIWGRVTKDGRPVSGAKVEIAGDQRLLPVYFNALHLPDRNAEATTENGLFAFVWVTPGIQSVRVRVDELILPAQIIPAESGQVSYMEIEVGEVTSSELEIYDPLDPTRELNATLRWAGDETSEVQIQGRGRLYFPHGPGRATLEALAGDLYDTVRLNISRSSRSIHVPMVRRDWIESVAARKRVNLMAGVGVVVGFMVEDDFVVHITGETKQSVEPEIVYFDPQGQALFTEEGVAGGGFVIFNAELGLKTVTIVKRSKGTVFTQAIVVEPEVTNVIRP